MNWKVASLLVLLSVVPVAGQRLNTPQFEHVTITMKTEGGPCLCLEGIDLSCCPAYVVSLDEKGTVTYNGGGRVKVRGEKTHSISTLTVRDLVADFYRIDFFSLDDRYEYERLPNGDRVTTDHANATTISIDLDGKKKSVYIFYGAPQKLIELQRKLYDAAQIAQYVGGASESNHGIKFGSGTAIQIVATDHVRGHRWRFSNANQSNRVATGSW